MNQKSKVISILIIFTFFANVFSINAIGVSKPLNCPICITVPDDYPTIQDAIDNADSGDCIFVKNGTYRETITINVNNLTLQGEDKHNTILEGNGDSDVVSIKNINCTKITNFTIMNSKGWSGIVLTNSSSNKINRNIIKNCDEDGIDLYDSHLNMIEKNNIAHCGEIGIDIDLSSCNLIKNNEVADSNFEGIKISNSDRNIFETNIIINSRYVGLDMVSSNDNNISGNVIEKNLLNGVNIWSCNNNSFLSNIIQYNSEDGLWMYYSYHNILRYNIIQHNIWNGVDIVHSYQNLIKDNIVINSSDNAFGIYYSDSNFIHNNTFLNNGIGIYLFDSDKNEMFFNNFIDSFSDYGHACFYDSYDNIWDKNYWDDWVGLKYKFGIKRLILRKSPKFIHGHVPFRKKSISCFNLDMNPADEAYDYSELYGLEV